MKWGAFLLAMLAFIMPREVCAEEMTVPVALQVPLLTKVTEYDRRFVERAQGFVHVLIVTRTGNAESLHAATELQTGLSRVDRIAGLPHDEAQVSYAGASQLAELIQKGHVSVVFLAPGFRPEVAAIAQALSGVDVLTASMAADDVRSGIVLGFDLISGHPKILVNLRQARLQKIDFRSDLLRLAMVFE